MLWCPHQGLVLAEFADHPEHQNESKFFSTPIGKAGKQVLNHTTVASQNVLGKSDKSGIHEQSDIPILVFLPFGPTCVIASTGF